MPLTREILNESLQLGSNFLLENQKQKEILNMNITSKKKNIIEDDNQGVK